MANETFPVQTTQPNDAGAPSVVAQLDLSELDSKLAPPLTDPTAEFKRDDASRPDVAKPTKGPHRYTIYVPHDEGARINVGAPHSKKGEPGITMATRSHIQAFAYDEVETCLTLGVPAKNSASITNQKTAGYALQTWGASNHFAAFQVAIGSIIDGVNIAGLLDVRLDSKIASVGITGGSAVNVSSPGTVQITAGSELVPNTSFWSVVQAIGLVGAQAADFSAPLISFASPGASAGVAAGAGIANFIGGFATKDAKGLADYVILKSHKHIDKVLKHLAAITSLVLKFKKMRKEYKAAEGKWAKGKALGPWLIAVGVELGSLYTDYLKSAQEPDLKGDVGITAKKNITIGADGSTSISGVKGVSIAGFLTTSVSSVSVSVKGHKASSIWGGLGASLKALAGSIEIASDLKGASMTAKQDVKIASEAGKSSIMGELDVQLNSVSGKAFVHGKAGAYFGGGTGTGKGIAIKEKVMHLGVVRSADKFDEATGDSDYALVTIMDKVIQLQSGLESKVLVGSNLFDVKTKDMKVKTTNNVTVTASKILLG